MFKSEKILLFLLISVCLIVSLVLIDALMDPSTLIKTAYARFSGESDPAQEEVYFPELGEEGESLLEGTSTLLEDGWNLFRSAGFAFEIQFPKQVVQKSVLNQDALNAGVGVNPAAPVWQFRLDDPALYTGTNLVDASVLIHVLEGEDQQAACSAFKPGSIYQTPSHQRETLIETEINDVVFWKDEVIEGVMGEFYHRISYRTFNKGACYEITQLMHYRNIDSVFDEKLTAFDEEKVLSQLDEVVSTFSFLDVEPTFPEQTYALPKALSTAVSKATSEYVDGLDVSHWQGTINWTKVYNAGYVFTFAKGTEGVGWTDVMFHTNMNGGTQAGVYMGVYHFARPDLGNSAVDEANHFVDVAGEYLQSGYLRPVLDLEVGASLGKTKLSNWVLTWMQTVESKTGIAPLIYTNPSYIYNYLTEAVTEYDLWVAHWTCTPTPSYYYPNTGMWRDWAFWQYYGPGGCGSNAGYVPGITTNIDLNIFNGVESGLQAYDAATDQVWVSLISDSYNAPTPYYADITANLNGDFSGLIDFSFWWNCDAMETDASVVAGKCGALPVPSAGTCLSNDVGMKCIGMTNDIKVAEHTYTEVGNYTAKVIAKVGTEAPVEDRYKISTFNPIRSVTLTPASPALGPAGGEFFLNGKVDIKTSLNGVLQFSVEDPVTHQVFVSKCRSVAADLQSIQDFNVKLTKADPGQIVYQVYARYRPWGTCPITDQDNDDVSKVYTINWVDQKAYFELKTAAGDMISAGGVQDLAEQEPFQPISLAYVASNTSIYTPFQFLGVSFENAVNVANLQFAPALPVSVGADSDLPFEVSFEIQSSGDFSFDVVLNHDASSPNPFRFTVQGSAALSDNPILQVDAIPASPGESLVGTAYALQVNVELAPPVEGVLQVEIEDQSGNLAADSSCLEVPAGVQDSYSFDFSWLDESSGQQDYLIWTRYREYGTCPVEDGSEYDLSQGYQIDWQSDSPILALFTEGEEPILQDGIDSVGEQGAYQILERTYLLRNGSSTESFQIKDLAFSEISNLVGLASATPLPLEVAPDGEAALTIQFEVENPGAFSADVLLGHTASNPTPFSFSLQGEGVVAENPIQSISPQPLSPGQVLIDQDFDLQIAVQADAPVAGVLQISLSREDGSAVEEPFCQQVAAPGSGTYTYDLSWSESGVGLQDYTITASYFAREDCPAAGTPIGELVMDYQIDWQVESPVLEVLNQGGSLIASGGAVSLGQYEFYQAVELTYVLRNTSSTSALEISAVSFENLSRIDQVELQSPASLVLAPNGEASLEFSFLVDITGDFSFDIEIDHLGSNPTPYRITFQGSGVMTDNPIKYVLPTPESPGTSLIGTPYSLEVEVGLDLPDEGALQVSLLEAGSGLVSSRSCQNLVDNLDQARTISLVLNETAPGIRNYQLVTQYRAQGSCPVEGSQESDLSQSYSVIWGEELPNLEAAREDGTSLPAGIVDNLGEQEFYQLVEFGYLLRNTSSTTSLQIEAVNVESPVNVDQLSLDPSGPIALDPGEERLITGSFRVAGIGSFSFDLAITHSGENASPYRFTIAGSGVIAANPILGVTVSPASPGSAYIYEEYALQVGIEVDPPAPGVLQVALSHQGSAARMGETCFEILGEHSFVDVSMNWEESNPGDIIYDIHLSYQALGSCPLEGLVDAETSQTYQVSWLTHEPELIVNRPEGVTIFDGAVDYIGVHDFFRFVEVTYLISNQTNNYGPLIINSITAENLVNLREVIIEPAGPIEILPGDAQEIVISFQVLTLDAYSFDLVWDHTGSNPSPYRTGIMGDSKLNLGDAPQESWLYRFLEALIRSGFFLKLPIFGLILVRRKKRIS